MYQQRRKMQPTKCNEASQMVLEGAFIIALRFSNENRIGSGPLQDNAKTQEAAASLHFVYKIDKGG